MVISYKLPCRYNLNFYPVDSSLKEHATGVTPPTSLMYGKLIWVETELFRDRGGWINETQFVDQIGSPYLMAHGLGQPVKKAHTTVKFPETGDYHF